MCRACIHGHTWTVLSQPPIVPGGEASGVEPGDRGEPPVPALPRGSRPPGPDRGDTLRPQRLPSGPGVCGEETGPGPLQVSGECVAPVIGPLASALRAGYISNTRRWSYEGCCHNVHKTSVAVAVCAAFPLSIIRHVFVAFPLCILSSVKSILLLWINDVAKLSDVVQLISCNSLGLAQRAVNNSS